MDNTIFTLRTMKKEDFDEVHELWTSIKGFAIRSMDDSKEAIVRFIDRNPSTSIVAVADGRIIGTILCGHDGRHACFYHVCVDEHYRKHGIGKAMADEAIQALKKEGISKVFLVAFKDNEIGNEFWQEMGWVKREDLNRYEYTLQEQTITRLHN